MSDASAKRVYQRREVRPEELELRGLLVQHYYSLQESVREAGNKTGPDLYRGAESNPRVRELLSSLNCSSIAEFLAPVAVRNCLNTQLLYFKHKPGALPGKTNQPMPTVDRYELEGDDEDIHEISENMLKTWLGSRVKKYSFQSTEKPVYRTGAMRGLTECRAGDSLRKYGISCLNMKDYMCNTPETVNTIVINFARDLFMRPFYVIMEKYVLPNSARTSLRNEITTHTIKFYEFGESGTHVGAIDMVQTQFFVIEAVPLSVALNEE